ncbi:hypothetical protein E2C01_045460 [Portunus trituberculatus]|uniref:Uncharacterized protein n=1 Tax=Portunus trituberculatus TaxID=210409 RepID=A0A5B7FVU9_PORTR|nr:hypothetical protein [Portunus trituberculatus]
MEKKDRQDLVSLTDDGGRRTGENSKIMKNQCSRNNKSLAFHRGRLFVAREEGSVTNDDGWQLQTSLLQQLDRCLKDGTVKRKEEE